MKMIELSFHCYCLSPEEEEEVVDDDDNVWSFDIDESWLYFV